MKLGYPCINLSLSCRASRTFRLKSCSTEKLIETVSGNLDCLEKMVDYNIDHDLLFLRITSDLIPFASHEVNNFNWQSKFADKFKKIGSKIKEADMRITMHPGQYTVLNSDREEVFQKAVKEIVYHVDVLDLLGLDKKAKVNIHVGGIYGNKEASMKRFVSRYNNLDQRIKDRLIIENDERSYSVSDCLKISDKTGIPVTFDNLHHEINNNGEDFRDLLNKVFRTWKKSDGPPVVHYSSQKPDEREGRHVDHINEKHFKEFIKEMKGFDFDLILEIKDKEKSAKKALRIVCNY